MALSPGPDGPDRDGVWSGCARVVDGVPALFYTGVVGTSDADRVESVCRADGSADLRTWWRSPDNPLVAGPPPGYRAHRDPFVFRDGDSWALLLGTAVGTGTHEEGGGVLVYRSDDLRRWRLRGVAFSRPSTAVRPETGRLWECPQLLRDDEGDVLVASVHDDRHDPPTRYAVWFAGRFVGDRFLPSADPAGVGVVDHGDVLYAPAVTPDATGRHLLWGWVREAPGRGEDVAYAGALSLPRAVVCRAGRLEVAPVAELSALRRPAPPARSLVLHAERPPVALGRCGHHTEVVLEVVAGSAPVALVLADADAPGTGADTGRGRHDGTPGVAAVRVVVDTVARRVELDRPVAGGTPSPVGVPLPAREGGGPVAVRVFLDGTVLEVFVDDLSALTARVPPLTAPSLRLGLAGTPAGAPVATAMARVIPLRAVGVVTGPGARQVARTR